MYSVTIEYCTKCGWLLRSAYMAQELLTTFENELEQCSLKPSKTSGTFKIFVNNNEVYCRKKNAGFPEIKALKQLIRDIIAPQKSLGHSDKT
jgi:selenoprotein W-related protein